MQANRFMTVLTGVVLLAVLALAPSGAAAETVAWEDVDQEDAGDAVSGWVDEKRHEQGIHLLPAGEHRYLLIAWGEKPTGGYKVEVKEGDIREWEGTIQVDAELVSPDPDDAVTQAITYPYALLRLPAGDSPVLVNFFGETWREAELEEARDGEDTIVLDPVLADDGTAPNPIVVRGWAQVFEATMQLVFEDGHIHLAEANLTLAAGGPEWAEFEIVLTYPNPTNPVGTVYGAYEDAKDGTRVEEGAVSVAFDGLSHPMQDICGHWAEASIRRAISAGFIHGYIYEEERYFAPKEEVTRAEFVKMLVASEAGEDPEVGDEDLPFEDMDGHWAESFVRWAIEEGWVNVDELGDRLYPDEVISRGEMAYLAARAAGLSEDTDPELDFVDEEEIPSILRGWVASAVDEGLLRGYPDDTFRVGAGLNRAESVVVVWRVLEKIN